LWTNDWAWRGLHVTPPFVLGHEFAGTIEEVGPDVRRWTRGDRVVFPMNPGDGTCQTCMSGNQHVCESSASLVPGVAYWGAFGAFVAVRYADVNLVRLPETLSFVDAAGLACRYMAAFHGLVDQVNIRGGEWLAVHGCGGMGLSAVEIGVALGARVVAVDVTEPSLEAARRLGAYAIDASVDDPVAAIQAVTAGGAHVSVDALGLAETCRNSVLSLRRRGRHLQLGHTTRVERGDVALPIDHLLLNELRLFGGFGMQGHRFDTMLGMINAGTLHPGKVVSRTVTLEEVTSVLDAMSRYDTVGLVVIDTF
jgi:D-arabinose 1-dehydrogenase-like Zn-dependent alcohol dehydrogenase